MPKFILPGDVQGTKVINDRYVFEDGVMIVPKAHVPLLEPILCAYYGCTVEEDEAPTTDPVDPPSTSLDKAVTTKPSKVSGAAAAEQK